MLILITYDVNTTSAGGKRRLRTVSKKRLDYGQRVQNSVFECILDSTQFKQIKYQLEEIIDAEKDSLRFYNLGDKYKKKLSMLAQKNHMMQKEP